MLITWVEKPLVLAIHDRELAEHGGTDGVRDATLLESALARPQQLFAYGDPAPDIADLAATLAYGLARNHPFVDGNKRTAAVACETFIVLNDAILNASDLDLYPLYLALAEGKLTEREFAAWLRRHIAVALGNQIHEAPARYGTKRKRADAARAKLARSNPGDDDLAAAGVRSRQARSSPRSARVAGPNAKGLATATTRHKPVKHN